MVLFEAAVLFRAREYPSVPLAVYMLFVPTYFALVRKMLWPTAKPTQFLSACSGYLLLNAIGLLWMLVSGALILIERWRRQVK